MKSLLRIVLFGVFAAMGLALAVGVAATLTDAPTAPPDPPQLAVRVVTDDGPQAVETLRPLQDEPRLEQPHSMATSIRAPIVAAPYPSIAQQSSPELERARMQQAYEFIRQQMGEGAATAPSPPAPAAAAQAEVVPAAPSTEPVLPSPAPTTGRSSVLPPRAETPKVAMDKEADGRLSIHITNAELREVLDFLSEQGGLNILAGTSVQGKVSATLNGVDIQSALDAILRSTGYVARRDGQFIFVGTAEEFLALEQSQDRIATRVYRPNYVTSAELQKLIQPILTERTGVVTVSTPSEMGIAADAANAGGDNFAGSDVVVVRDYEAVLAMVDQVFHEVDIRPLQVHIEAMILSVKLKDTDRYGVNFQLLRDKHNIKLGLGAPETALANVKFEQGSLKFGFLDSSLGAFLDALETIGDTSVIATPRLMVINKHRAEIQIGEQKGYVSTTVTETSSTQAVQFLDIGALLRLRPFISSDGMIRMEVHPELSDGTVKTESGFTLPEKEVTQVTTNIMVRNGCTVVIGGLMRESLATNTSQVPVLGNVPGVGFLFRSSTETTERREVVVLITPHIVYDTEASAEGDKVACEFHRRQSLYADKMMPLNKRSLAHKYFRLAQGAWAAGQRDRALRFAELSVHTDPLNRAAIDLRSDIWLGNRHGEHTLEPASATIEPERLLDDPNTMHLLLDEIEHAPAAAPAVSHPVEPGQPGRRQDILRPTRLQ
jgi:type IV pilus assembly protein PilQ